MRGNRLLLLQGSLHSRRVNITGLILGILIIVASPLAQANTRLEIGGDAAYVRDDAYHVLGVVRNQELTPVTNVTVKGTFFDENDRVVSTVEAPVMGSDVWPGESAPFHLTVEETDIARYQLEVGGEVNQQSDFAPTDYVAFLQTGTYHPHVRVVDLQPSYDGQQLTVIGAVVNDGPTPVKSMRLVLVGRLGSDEERATRWNDWVVAGGELVLSFLDDGLAPGTTFPIELSARTFSSPGVSPNVTFRYDVFPRSITYGLTVAQLVQQLQDPDPATREDAAQTLRARGPRADNAVPALADLFRHEPVDEVSEAAALALIAIGPASVPALSDILRESDIHLRRRAAYALGEIGPGAADAVPALAKALRDESEDVGRQAVESLGNLRTLSAFTALVDALVIGDSNIPDIAATKLIEIGAPAVPALTTALLEPTFGIRWAAARILGEIGPEAADAVPALTHSLRDNDPDVRVNSAWALGQMMEDATSAVPALIDTLQDDDVAMRLQAADALGAIGSAANRAVLPLTELLHEENNDLRNVAGWAIEQIGPAGVHALKDLVVMLDASMQRGDNAEANLIFWVIQQLELPAGDDWMPQLGIAYELARLLLERSGELYPAIDALISTGPQAAVPLLLEGLQSDDAATRYTSVWMLASIAPTSEPAVTTLVGLAILGSDSSLRRMAGAALAEIGSPAVPVLVEALKDTTSFRRERPYHVLAQIGPEAGGAVDALDEVMRQGPDMDIRELAAQTLMKIDPISAVPMLIDALKSEDDALREVAVSALGSAGPAAQDAFTALVDVFRSSASTGEAAAQALMSIDPQATLPLLIDALQGDKKNNYLVHELAAKTLEDAGPAAEDAVPALIAALRDDTGKYNLFARRQTALTLGAIGPVSEDVVPALVDALQDPYPEVRAGAATALGRIGPEAGVAVPALVTALRDVRADVQMRAAQALGDIGPEAKMSVPALTEALQDHSDRVRRAAADAIHQITGERPPGH